LSPETVASTRAALPYKSVKNAEGFEPWLN
jgi:hypothetical protein